MKAGKAIAKTFMLGVGLVSLMAVAETYYDQKFYTADFMDEVKEVRFDIPAQKEKRIVASFEKKLPIVQEVPLSMANLIDGKWQITKVINDQGETTFNSNNRTTTEQVVVEAKLISKSVVRINEDIDQTYMVSLLTQSGTLALFKEFGEGYEIVEARRVNEVKKEVAEQEQAKEEDVKKPKYDIQEDLFLVSALDPKKNKNVLRANDLEGYAYLRNGELILENIRLHVGSKNQTEVLSTEALVRAHGTFNDDRGTQGIVTNISNDEIKVRFSTGPLAGAMLNFVTYDKKSKIEEKFGAATQQIIPEQAAPINAQEEAPEQYQENAPGAQDDYREEYQEDYRDEYSENTPEEFQEEVYEEEYYEEVDGQRVNDGQMPQFDEGQADDFEQMRQESRYPSSVEPDAVGFSF